MDDSRRVSLLLGLLFGLAGMGSSSAAIALPLMGDDLGVGVGVAAWTISLYVLMLAVTTAIYGRVSDLVGIRLPLIFGIGLMTAGALVAAFAPNFGTLLVARMFQGAGAAAVPTLGVALLSSRYAGEQRGLALGRLAGMAAAVSCLGPFIGGAVENAFGWRAVMALPILGALVLPFLWRTLAGGGSGARLDLVGAVMVAGTAGGLVLLVQSPTTGAAVAVLGLLLLLLGAPAVAFRVRRRPCGFPPAPWVVRDRHRRAQCSCRRGDPGRLVRAARRGAGRSRPARVEAWEVGLLSSRARSSRCSCRGSSARFSRASVRPTRSPSPE